MCCRVESGEEEAESRVVGQKEDPPGRGRSPFRRARVELASSGRSFICQPQTVVSPGAVAVNKGTWGVRAIFLATCVLSCPMARFR